MTPLSWNEIRSRAIRFSKDWENAEKESAESQTFWNEFFNVFGISRRRVATFEWKAVHNDDRPDGFVDVLWPNTLIIEHKSRGKNLDKAYEQAKGYFPAISEAELPKYILVSDFENFRLYDLDTNEQHQFQLKDLVKHIRLFGFIAGYQKQTYKDEDPVNIEAAELMGQLHDKLKETGYKGHQLEVYLVRLVFCLFADDTTIFNKNIFYDFLRLKTREDGSDLAPNIALLFQVLNTPDNKRSTNLDDLLKEFPYVDGTLFEETLPIASFDSEMRELLFKSCTLNWSMISPAVFGSLFQSVMNPEERRNLGAHYTSEKNILKVVKSLFLDDLYSQFESVKNNKKKLVEFHNNLSLLKFLDPACGCGNFLVITYRELRLLEIEILKVLTKNNQLETDIENIILINIDQFYGIELEEWPARISEVAMWLIDHQMNMKVSEEFGEYFARIPLTKNANIIIGNALWLNWNDIVSNKDLSYILGNPPFVGKQYQSIEQKKNLSNLFLNVHGSGILDYVTGWYIKAAQYIQNTTIKVAFVSTNSITQGEQVGVLWNELFNNYNIKIHFAHRTFKWSNEARKNAGVHVVIIGFGVCEINEKLLFEYDNFSQETHRRVVKNINSYLVEGKNIIVLKRRTPICDTPSMIKGSMPNDGGYLILNKKEKDDIINKEPNAKPYIKKYMGGDELINNRNRWCLWLIDAKPTDLKDIKSIYERINSVRGVRSESKRKTTIEQANTPTLFGEIRQPDTDYLAIPEVSSENRKYIPIGFISKDTIGSNKIYMVPNANLYMFGILNSMMHMSWINQISGRLESRFQYSTGIVYNNFPWPESPTENKKKK